MIVSLFGNQLVLDVPENTNWICFERMPKIVEFCAQFEYDRIEILTDRSSAYFSLCIADQRWYTTTKLHTRLYNATDELLQLMQQPKAYEYW